MQTGLSPETEKIQESDVSNKVKKDLTLARKYAGGTGVSLIVKDDSLLEDLKKLIKIKVGKQVLIQLFQSPLIFFLNLFPVMPVPASLISGQSTIFDI